MTENKSNYMPQLDALRGLAVLGVLVEHFLPGHLFVHQIISWGGLGVSLFFVLSGFLITGILLRYRQMAAGGQRPGQLLRIFYLRRFLRIFPIYYLTLLIAFLLGLTVVRETLFWHLTYLSNVLFALTGSWYGPIGHFWSLSVEEQFYIFWPCVILFVPEKHLLKTIVMTIALGFLSRLAFGLLQVTDIARSVLVIQNMDLLGSGASLAYGSLKPAQPSQFKTLFLKTGPWAGLLIIPFFQLQHWAAGNSWSLVSACLTILFNLSMALFFAWLIAGASAGFQGLPGKILQSKGLVYLGTISYGIYIYHNFVKYLFEKALFSLSIDLRTVIKFPLTIAITLAVATLSWYLLEKPINSFKRYFEPEVQAAGAGMARRQERSWKKE